MNKYKINACEIVKTVYIVEAPSPEDAIDLLCSGEYETMLEDGSEGVEFDFPILIKEV